MGITLYKEPKLDNPDLIASWPGIGNIGLIAADTLRAQTRSEELGEIEPWDFFYPRKVIIRSGVLEELEFPTSRFYYKRLARKDVIFFIGEEQPADGERMYAEGRKAYRMASLVLDVAEKLGCRRVYTSGAAVALTHHEIKPRVWAVGSRPELLTEARGYKNTVLKSDVIGKGDHGSITGLNGLLLGLARARGLEAMCLMGEIPDYLSGAPFPYPRASAAVVEVLAERLGVEVDFESLNQMSAQVDQVITGICEKLPPDIREKIDQRKQALRLQQEGITEEDERWIKDHIEELFKRGGREHEQPS
ncbi:MAG: PAC2 family protein [Chloroflexi bacterium]|nr:PAC2 family protein [Chloroflexota bacterium]